MRAYNYKQVPASGFYFAVNIDSLEKSLTDSPCYIVHVTTYSQGVMIAYLMHIESACISSPLNSPISLMRDNTDTDPYAKSTGVPEEVLIGPISIDGAIEQIHGAPPVCVEDVMNAYSQLGTQL